MKKQRSLATLALFTNPIVGDWDTAESFVDKLIASDPEHLGYLGKPDDRLIVEPRRFVP